jgi:hypothetical protein
MLEEGCQIALDARGKYYRVHAARAVSGFAALSVMTTISSGATSTAHGWISCRAPAISPPSRP